MSENKKSIFPIKGIIPPMITPLSNFDELDRAGTKKLVEHCIAGGVAALFIMGSTGEGPSLSYKIRREFIALVVEIVAKRVPVLVGITDTAVVELLSLARLSYEVGADCIVFAPPYYFPAGQTELKQLVDLICKELPEDLPIMLYNMPSLVKVSFEIETVRYLMKHKQIVGIKDSSGDMDYYAKLAEIKRETPSFNVLMGPEMKTVEAVQMGTDGGVSGGANAYPRLYVEMYNATIAGDKERIEKAVKGVAKFQDCYEIGKYASRKIKANKCACFIKGLTMNVMAPPFNKFLFPEETKIRTILEEVDQLEKACFE